MPRKIIHALAIATGIALLGAGLFVLNGLVLAKRETPISGITAHPAASPDSLRQGMRLKVLSYNIAKGFIHEGGVKFVDKQTAIARLRRIAEVIRAEKPDLVFLSETVFECTPCPLNQITYLAEETGMHAWAFGENYNVGLPFYRIVGGNAILSRWDVELVANPSLAGRKPFYVATNNRRVLWCALTIGTQKVLLGSVHNDSYSLPNNLRQAKQILEYVGNRPTLMAGDFNENPHEPAILAIRDSGRFLMHEGPLTFPSDKPNQRIDFVFAPKTWKLTDHRVIETNASDHLPVVSTFVVSL